MLSVPHTTLLWLTHLWLFQPQSLGAMCKPTGSISLQGHWTTWNYRTVDTTFNQKYPELLEKCFSLLISNEQFWSVVFYISLGCSQESDYQVLMMLTKAVIHSSLLLPCLIPPTSSLLLSIITCKINSCM